jgi:hypothetical protein
LNIAAADGRLETVRPTGLHKFFRPADAAWVSAADLCLGDELLGTDGPLVVRRKTRVPGLHRVYNLTVEGEHVYRVSDLGALVHNNGCGVQPYQVGNANDLRARSKVGDKTDIHHAGQSHPFEQLIPGYKRSDGPAIALPNDEHQLIPTLTGTTNLTARQVLAQDIRNLRNLTNAPNVSLQELISLNRFMYPEAFIK